MLVLETKMVTDHLRWQYFMAMNNGIENFSLSLMQDCLVPENYVNFTIDYLLAKEISLSKFIEGLKINKDFVLGDYNVTHNLLIVFR